MGNCGLRKEHQLKDKTKRFLVLTLITILFVTAGFMNPAHAATSTDLECRALMGIASSPLFDTDYYKTTVPTRLQAALVLLNLLGIADEALAFSGDVRFDDADSFCGEVQSVLAYLKANPHLGWVGTGGGKFDPTGDITTQAYYKIMLHLLGYRYGVDFTWNDIMAFSDTHGLYRVTDDIHPTFKDLEKITVIGMMLAKEGAHRVTADEAVARLAAEEVIALDLRSLPVRNQGYLIDSVHVPLANIRSEKDDLQGEVSYLVYCDQDVDAAYATSLLRNVGLDAYVIAGGFKSLREAGAPIREAEDIESILYGWVSAGEPVAGAKLTIHDRNGNTVYQGDTAVSTETGAFRIAVKNLPLEFRIVSQGGRHMGEAFESTLMADYANVDSGNESIYINAATTMVSKYLDANPGATFDEAVTSVKDILDLPEWINIGTGLRQSSEYFNYYTFLSEASTYGGIDGYVDYILATGEPHPFKSDMPMLQSPAGTVATALAKGAATHLGGELMGWGLSKAGIDFGNEDLTAEQLERIEEGMLQMQNEMKVISAKLDNIIAQLNALEQQLDAIRRQALESEYNQRADRLNTLQSHVAGIQRDLAAFVNNPTETKRQSLMESIREKIIYEDLSVHSLLAGGSGAKGLLQLYSEVIYSNRFISLDDYRLIKMHFEQVHRLQESLLLLQVEYYHAMEYDSQFIIDLIESHNGRITTQTGIPKAPIPANVVIDTNSHVMYYVEHPVTRSDDGAFATLPHYLMPLRIYFEMPEFEHRWEIADRWNEEAKLGFRDWQFLCMIPKGPGGVGEFLDGLKSDSSENVMDYLEGRGWPPMLDAMVIDFFDISSSRIHTGRDSDLSFNEVTTAAVDWRGYRDHVLLRLMGSDEPAIYYFTQ